MAGKEPATLRRRPRSSPARSRTVGTKVERFRPGQRVACWLNPFNEPPRALAEQVAVPAAQCVRVPDGIALEQAAVTPVAGLSALQLADMIETQPDQRVLVHGAAGGVGSFVVPILRDRGAFVVVTGSARSQSYLRQLQPDAQVDYANPAASWPGPFDAIIDCAARLDPRRVAGAACRTAAPSRSRCRRFPACSPTRC